MSVFPTINATMAPSSPTALALLTLETDLAVLILKTVSAPVFLTCAAKMLTLSPLLQVSPLRPPPPSQCLQRPRPHQPPPLPPPPPCQTAPQAQSSCTFWRGKFEGLVARQEYEKNHYLLSSCHITGVSIQQ